MKSMDYWRLARALTVSQAAALIVGSDPAEIAAEIERRGKSAATFPPGFLAVSTALQNDIEAGQIPANIKASAITVGAVELIDSLEGWKLTSAILPNGGKVPEGAVFFFPAANAELTTILVDDLRNWLRASGVKTGFFFEGGGDERPAYLDPGNPRYAKKLAAAVEAWLAVDVKPGSSPKKALDEWLRGNVARFGLSDSAITQCAEVANWQYGGAPQTPG